VALAEFREPTGFEKAFNKIFGMLVGLGLGMQHNYLLEVRGRKSGRMFTTPVSVLDVNDKLYLVAPRGRTQWVRNAEAAGEIVLRKGSTRSRYAIRPVEEAGRPELLKEYVDRFKTTVQRYFPVPAGSAAEAFGPIAKDYPVFELSGT
jgi:deazaflavin-dependent oxidoreductase (nitroreductase family)